MPVTIIRFICGDDGQDLVEYALLVAFVGLAVLAAWLAMEDAIRDGYIRFDTQEQDLSAGGDRFAPVTPDPQ